MSGQAGLYPGGRLRATTASVDALLARCYTRAQAGETATMQCLSCGHDNSDDALFCERCAGDLVALCPSCNRRNNPGVPYCRYCRTPLESESAQSTPQTTSVAPAQSTQQPTSFANGPHKVQKLLAEGGKKRGYLAHDSVLRGPLILGPSCVSGGCVVGKYASHS